MSFLDQKWRLNNLYRIIDRNSNSIPFRLNKVQEDVLDSMHSRNLILKARQLGMSTFAVLYLLDETLFNENLSSGIVSYSLEHAQHIFKKIIGHALDTLPKEIRSLAGVIQRSAREINFNNGSSLRVDTTLRGGSYPLVLISEFGKTCARNPQKAEEVITGTLQAVPATGKVIIESTGEGNEGFFAEMVTSAARRGNEQISNLEYKLFFYNWLNEPSYVLTEDVKYDTDLSDYFEKIEKEQGITITKQQRSWYAIQCRLLGDKIKQEFPSSISEAFLSTSDAYYFSDAITSAYDSNRCLYSPLYDALLPVYVAMDIGVNDLTVMIFFQIAHGEVRVIDYYEDKNKGVDFYAKFLLQDKKYLYNTIFLPHDSNKRSPLDVSDTYMRDFQRLFSATSTRFHILKRMDKQLSISHAKIMMARCVFNVSKVKNLLDNISKYRKKWNESLGKYMEEPLHNEACFIGETLIETELGQTRIDKISIGDMVKTPNGYKKVTKVYCYKTKNLIKISKGKNTITCTPHHMIFTKRGLITADSLVYNDHIITLKDEDVWKQIGFLGREKGLGFKDYFLSMNQNQLSYLMDISTKRTNSGTGLEERQDQKMDMGVFIDPYGFITKVKYLINSIFITSMEISRTIQSKILNLFPIQTICACTCQQKNVKNYQESQLVRLLKHQKNGMDQNQVLNGTENMQKKLYVIKYIQKKYVSIVQNIIKHVKDFQSIALQVVNPHIDVIQEETMKSENAKYALKNLNVVNILLSNPAQDRAEQCLDTEKEVYDLTVENDHCYFANGFLVSNSNYADAFQYLTQSVSHLETASSLGGALEKHKSVVDGRRKRLY